MLVRLLYREAVKLNCLQCLGFNRAEIARCTCTRCPLYSFRPTITKNKGILTVEALESTHGYPTLSDAQKNAILTRNIYSNNKRKGNPNWAKGRGMQTKGDTNG